MTPPWYFVCIWFYCGGPGIAGVLAFCEHLGASFVPLGKPACGRMRPPQWHVCSTMHIFSESIRHHVSLCGFAHRGVCTNTLVWCHYCTVWQILILKVCVLDIARPLWVAAWLEIVSAGFVLDSKNQPHLALSILPAWMQFEAYEVLKPVELLPLSHTCSGSNLGDCTRISGFQRSARSPGAAWTFPTSWTS